MTDLRAELQALLTRAADIEARRQLARDRGDELAVLQHEDELRRLRQRYVAPRSIHPTALGGNPMTDSTTELDDFRAQVERLSTKNRELLAENRQLKDRERQQTEALTALQARQRRHEVDAPVAQLIDDVAVPGATDAFRVLLDQHVRFEATDDGQLVIRDPQGQPVKLPALPGVKGREVEREVRATASDLRALVDLPGLREKFAAITVASRASGGGAAGGSTTRAVQRQAQRPAGEQRPEPKLGLR